MMLFSILQMNKSLALFNISYDNLISKLLIPINLFLFFFISLSRPKLKLTTIIESMNHVLLSLVLYLHVVSHVLISHVLIFHVLNSHVLTSHVLISHVFIFHVLISHVFMFHVLISHVLMSYVLISHILILLYFNLSGTLILKF